jgi:hypothetical protein
MGITADIGQDVIDIYIKIAEGIGISDDDYWAVYGWCDEHDNNTMADMCSCCKGEHGYPDTDAEIHDRIVSYIEDVNGADYGYKQDYTRRIARYKSTVTKEN